MIAGSLNKLIKSMKKILFPVFIFLAVAAWFIMAAPAESRLAAYYSGDAISYNKQLYVASTNTGSLEIFKLQDKELALIADQRVHKPVFNTYDDFFDVKFNIENNRLYIYAVSHYTIYKYELNGNNLSYVDSRTNTYWDWYNRVDKFGDDLVVISAKGIKLMNTNLDFIMTYEFNNLEAPYNLSSDSPRFFLSVNESQNALEVYDRETQKIITHLPLEFKHAKGNRRAYQDAAGYIYVVDDVYARKFNIAGDLLASFKHLDFQGFDIQASPNSGDVYFTNGVGIVKLDKDMNLKDYAWISNLGGQLSWAMGLKVVYHNGDKAVIFNNLNILVVDADLNKVAAVDARKEAKEYPLENLFLNLDKYKAAANSDISVSGGGFLTKTEVAVYFNDKLLADRVLTDNRGRFTTIIKVPELKAGAYDIRVDSLSSEASYSISFQVE